MGPRAATLLRAAPAIAAALAAGRALPQPATWESWGGRVANEVARFMPGPLAGLVDRHPWEPGQGAGRPWKRGECTDGSCPWFPLQVGQEWRVADPALAKEIEALEHQAPARTLEEAQERMEALARQGKYDEARKLAESMGRIESAVAAADPSLQGQDPGTLAGRLEADSDRASRLKEERTRTLRFRIAVNLAPSVVQEGGGAKPIGSIKGYALHRQPKTFQSPGRAGATLSVWLGPPGFKNSPGSPEPRMRGAVKGILVEATTTSTREHAAADESLARQMIEKVDLPGLAGLLQP